MYNILTFLSKRFGCWTVYREYAIFQLQYIMYDSFVAFIVELAIEFQYLVTPTYYLHVPYANFNLENPCGVVYSDIQLHQTIYDFTN